MVLTTNELPLGVSLRMLSAPGSWTYTFPLLRAARERQARARDELKHRLAHPSTVTLSIRMKLADVPVPSVEALTA